MPHRFIGQVWSTGFYFTNTRRSFFQPGGWLFVCGNLIGLPDGTGVEATFRFNPGGLLALLAPILMSIGLTIEDAILARDSVWIWVLICVILSVFAATVRYCVWSNKTSQVEMLDYLRQALGVTGQG
jgi:hypothetical protein